MVDIELASPRVVVHHLAVVLTQIDVRVVNVHCIVDPLAFVGQLFVALVFADLAVRMPLTGYSNQWGDTFN